MIVSSFDDLETMFLIMYVPPVAYHTLLTQFTQIHLKTGERIRDFNLIFFKTLNQILEEQKPNTPIVLGCYKNEMSSNVKFAIKSSQIEDLDEAMHKGMNMEEIMIEKYVDHEIILGKVQRQMDNISLSNQGV
jgi:hypothetical protein